MGYWVGERIKGSLTTWENESRAPAARLPLSTLQTSTP